jgi:molecular chaperone GrpE
VQTIAPEPGDPFDPNHHEALMQEPGNNVNVKPGHVTKLLQKGYMLHDRTLRPAQVAVAK